MLKFLSGINCFLLHWTKKLTLGFCYIEHSVCDAAANHKDGGRSESLGPLALFSDLQKKGDLRQFLDLFFDFILKRAHRICDPRTIWKPFGTKLMIHLKKDSISSWFPHFWGDSLRSYHPATILKIWIFLLYFKKQNMICTWTWIVQGFLLTT